jgi:hypothetical protein
MRRDPREEKPAAILDQESYFSSETCAGGLVVGWGSGLPSAILGSAAVVRKRVIAARASMSRFTVDLLMAKGVRTVIPCRR